MIEYFTPVLDGDVPAAHQPTLAKYRQLASEHGVPVTMPVCYQVKAGFTLKGHAAEAGPCHDGFIYLLTWNFPDVPTTDSLVFWVPRIIEGSTSKTKDQQIKLLADLRSKLELPSHHLAGFGQVGLLAGLILAHFKVTDERLPLHQFWVNVDTCCAGGNRLGLGRFVGAGLFCGRNRGDGAAADSLLGVFAHGVEELDG